MTRHADALRFLRFAGVGAGFAFGYALVTALLVGPLGWPSFATSVGVYALCIPMAFWVQRHVTFGLRRTHRGGFAIYAGTQLLSLAAVTAVTSRFVTQNVAQDTSLYLATAGVAAVVSFVISKRFAFRPPGG